MLYRDDVELPRTLLPAESEGAPPKALVRLDDLLAGAVLGDIKLALTDAAGAPLLKVRKERERERGWRNLEETRARNPGARGCQAACSVVGGGTRLHVEHKRSLRL